VTYRYVVQAYDAHGTYSATSQEVTAALTLQTLYLPAVTR
jgi:hypothetical protein